MEWLTIIAKALGLADFLAKWSKQNADEKTGAMKNQNAGLVAQAKEATADAKIDETVHNLSDADLDSRLRGGGVGSPGHQ